MKKGAGNVGSLERPLRYRPENGAFVIEDGPEFFNRPLYGNNTAFRVDAGDKPEFSPLFLPGHGGNLRLGIRTPSGAKWCNDVQKVVARYDYGAMTYELTDPLWGHSTLKLAGVVTSGAEGLVLQLTSPHDLPADVQLLIAFGGLNGERGARDGDIGTEKLPVSQFFQLRRENCKDNRFTFAGLGFELDAPAGHVACSVSELLPKWSIVDARDWDDPSRLAAGKPSADGHDVALGAMQITPAGRIVIALQKLRGRGTTAPASQPPARPIADIRALAALFADSLEARRKVATQIVVKTPDPFIDAAVVALCVAADAIWDSATQSYMHGGVAWRRPLLGWRGPYCGDALGWHDRTRAHLERYFKKQNTSPIPGKLPPADEDSLLARSENALHSNGDLTGTHYDMNLVAIDALFRHLMWTGDLDYAKKVWPVIERHLAWERRLFRREVGPDKLPLYEAYACIWASDDLGYSGGGATHATAYNYYHNLQASMIADAMGFDHKLYDEEAQRIHHAMMELLWLPESGWFAEWKDLLGAQSLHPSAALWSYYHTVDCLVADRWPLWEMSRQIDAEIPHLPLRGPGVPDDRPYATLACSNWMPYTYSINNVVMAEVAHTALADFNTGRNEDAFTRLKSAVLDSMFMGLCPGNFHMCSELDANRRESQRDFGDPIGITARAVVEGLFGIQHASIKSPMMLRPKLPESWDRATLDHPDLSLNFERKESVERWTIQFKGKPEELLMMLPARRSRVEKLTVNGKACDWKNLVWAAGSPEITGISTPGQAANKWEVEVHWAGDKLVGPVETQRIVQGHAVELSAAPAELLPGVIDPQKLFENAETKECSLRGTVVGVPGARTAFVMAKQGDFQWHLPVHVSVLSKNIDKARVLAHGNRSEAIDLSSRLNDRVTQIFKNDYRSPRSPYCSLAIPLHGIGAWAGSIKKTANIDDAGLRALAAKGDGKIKLPDGVSFVLPIDASAKNIAFVSQWDNYPREISIPLEGKSPRAHLLLAGSTNHMQSRFDNGEIVVAYFDGSTDRLALVNPTNWWPIEQDYLIDDYAFRREEPVPVRIELKTGNILVRSLDDMKKQGGRTIDGGAATVLELDLDPAKTLKSLTLRAIANEVVIGLMALTLER